LFRGFTIHVTRLERVESSHLDERSSYYVTHIMELRRTIILFLRQTTSQMTESRYARIPENTLRKNTYICIYMYIYTHVYIYQRR